jgi:hypothetical protein
MSVLAAALTAATIASSAAAQTPIEAPGNRFTPAQDVELGREAAAEVRKQMPLLNDDRTEDFVEDLGERLIEEIPDQFRHPEFRYSFDVVNLREVNAFALPGGPMFLHRGMIEAARTEGEIAGVMAHELSHVVLRHGTAQATKGQKFQIGAIGLGAYFLKYGREYERQADLLGAQIMARAGYDPRQMASMFQTIERQGGNRGPEWLSSHPNPGDRVEAITREAEMLRVERASSTNGDLAEVHARLGRMSPAPTSEQVARAQQGRTQEPVGAGRRTVAVEPPAGQWQTHQPGNFLRLSVPANWRAIDGEGTVTYAPEGGYFRAQNGQSVFTHGVEIGVARGNGGSLQAQTEQLVRGFAQSNPDLRRQSGYSRATIGGRRGLTTTLSNVSAVTGERETVNLSTVQLRDGSLLFLIGVAPSDEARAYLNTFGRVRQSVRLEDR